MPVCSSAGEARVRAWSRSAGAISYNQCMNKAFTKESDSDSDVGLEDEIEKAPEIPTGSRNYMTPGGFARLKAELDHLVDRERPEVVSVVSWAAGNGDRSENGDYIYGKKRLREIDRRVRYLVSRLDKAEVVDPAGMRDPDDADRIFFGATVTVEDRAGQQRRISIVGVDEIDTARGYVSWVSPIARALLKARAGDVVVLRTPVGEEELEVVSVEYRPLETRGEDAVAG